MTSFHETAPHGASTSAMILAALACGSGAEPVQLSVAGANAVLYGTARMDAVWENHRVFPSPGNLAYWAETGKYARSGEWNFTGSNTKLGLNISGPDSGRSFKLAGKIEIDFSGSAGTENTPVPRLRHGYGSVSFPALGLSILAGQTWDVFSPLAAPTINTCALWFNGNVGYRRPQFRITETVPLAGTGKFEVAGAVARGMGVASPFVAASTDGGHDADIPVFEGRTAIGLPLWLEKRNATLGVSGHYGQEDILLADSTTYETLDSWSANIDLELPLAGFASLVGEGYYGENMDAYLGGIGQGFVRATGTSTLKNAEGWGG